MPFTLFTFVFLAAVFVAFFVLRVELRPYILAAASYAYCLRFGIRACAALTLTTFFVYGTGLLIGWAVKKKSHRLAGVCTATGIGVCVLSLLLFKYTVRVLPFGEAVFPALGGIFRMLVIPVGFSFYIFQAISYLADIRLGRIAPEKNPVFFALYLSFFPKFISGPIERSGSFLEQIRKLGTVKLWDARRYSEAFTYLIYGYFMKLVIADRLGIYADRIFSGFNHYGSLWLVAGSLFYTIQIYCDFAGYTNIAIGTAKLFGIDLSQNFDAPYLAQNITQFWRRWHMSLSSWLRDYIYIPLGGSRKGDGRKYLNILAVFLICGMWHGAGFHYVVWGLLHGLFSMADNLAKKHGLSFVRSGWMGRIITFCGVSFAWIFFRLDSFTEALRYIGRMFTAGFGTERFLSEAAGLSVDRIELLILLFSVLAVLAADLISDRKRTYFPVLLQRTGYVRRYLFFFLFSVILLVFGVYGMDYHVGQFIYMQF